MKKSEEILVSETQSLFGEVKAKIVPDQPESPARNVAETIEDLNPKVTKENQLVFYDMPDVSDFQKNVESFSDEELLAFLLENGSEEKRISNSKELLSANGNKLSLLFRKKDFDFSHHKADIGRFAAKRIEVVGEIIKRVLRENINSAKSICKSHDIFDMVREMAFFTQEELWLLIINSQNQCQEIIKLTKGTIDKSLIDVSLILSNVLRRGAVRFFIVHNHPGGSPTPSTPDNDITYRLKDACHNMGLQFLDHIIVYGPRDTDYYSYKDDGRI